MWMRNMLLSPIKTHNMLLIFMIGFWCLNVLWGNQEILQRFMKQVMWCLIFFEDIHVMSQRFMREVMRCYKVLWGDSCDASMFHEENHGMLRSFVRQLMLCLKVLWGKSCDASTFHEASHVMSQCCMRQVMWPETTTFHVIKHKCDITWFHAISCDVASFHGMIRPRYMRLSD